MKNYWFGFGSALACLLVLTLFLSYTSNSDEEEGNRPHYGEGYDPAEVQNEDVRQLPQIVRAAPLEDMRLCGELLSMENFDLRERLDRELLRNVYWHSSTLLILKQSRRYFPTIERILAEEGVPDDLKYLAVAESALRNATSPAGAKGIWQFMPATAREYDLEVTSTVDERYHLEKATRAACQYLRRYHDRFDDWLLTMAAYNMGPGGLSGQMEKQGGESFFDLNLSEETNAYIFRIAAFKAIFENPRAYGFYLNEEDYYPPLNDYRTEEVTETINNLGDWASEQGVSYRMLKVYNPWLVDSRLAVGRDQVYQIKVPEN
ncbi:MAG: lytic transglycosylase domain-containing protein [Bacteroidota bacterium]